MTRKFLHKTLVRNLDNLMARGGKAGVMLFLTGFSAIARGAGRVLPGLRGSGIAAGDCRRRIVREGRGMERKKPVKNNRSPTFFINFASPSLGVSAGGGDVNTKSK